MRFIIRWLSNIKVAIFLLAILILCSLIGSIVEQTDKPINQVLESTGDFSFSNISTFFRFSNVFNNGWFF